MKKWMKVVLGVFVGMSALLGLVFWLTGGIAKTADDFFAAVQIDDMDAAYAMLSEDFQAGTSKEEVKSYITENTLDNVTETYWGSRSKSGDTGELKGTMTTADGSKIQLELSLIDSEAGWRINAIEMANTGFRQPNASRRVPSVKKQQQLFRDTMAVFAESVSDRSMKKFWDNSAGSFRRQVSVEQLDKTFESEFQYSEGYSKIHDFKLIIDGAEINEETGSLSIRGHYQVKPRPVYFHQVFLYEGIDWKNTGLELKVGSAP